MNRLIRMTLYPLLLGALSACALLSNKSQTLTVYAPKLAQTAVAEGAPVPWQLLVQMPTAISPLDGSRIVVMPQSGVVEFYKGARWRDRAPTVVQELVLQSFQNSNRLIGVGTPASGIHGDYDLHLDLRDFQAEYRGTGVFAVIRLNAQLVDERSNRVLAARTFVVEQPCSGTAVPAVADAFERGLNALLPQLMQWTFASAEAKGSELAH